jgi:glycosyltransferase involved in cell wall biosynthesis
MIIVSIVITNYNYGKFLGRCIRSCLGQSINPNFLEIIVVDDCSTDESHAVMHSFKESIDPIFLTERRGVAHGSNIGIKKARGMYVMRVDADDYINEKMAEVLLMFLDQNPEKAFAYCDHLRVNLKEGREDRVSLDNHEILLEHGAGILFKKSCLEAIGLYDEEMLNCEDRLLIQTLIASDYTGIHVQLPLYRYVRHGENMTDDLNHREKWKKIAKEKYEK